MNFSEFREKKRNFDDSKLGSIIKLSIWIFLVALVAMYTRIGESTSSTASSYVSSKPTVSSIKEKLKSISSYEENVTIYSDIVENVHLICSFDKYLISYNGENFYKSDLLYLLSTREVTDNKLLSDIFYFNIKSILEYLESIDEDYIIIYKDNSFKVGYTIFVPTFEQGVNVVISGNQEINYIEIEFHNYYINKLVFDILNINNVEDIEVDL